MKEREITKIELLRESDWHNYSDMFDESDKDRKEAYERGAFEFIGIYAVAKVDLHKPTPQGGWQYVGTTEYRSGGLWGIEDDSDREYLKSIAEEQEAELRDILREEGFSDDEINDAPLF